MQSRLVVIAFVLGAVAARSLLFAAAPPFQALNRQEQNLNLVNPLQFSPDSGQNGTALPITFKLRCTQLSFVPTILYKT
jgi:hypothetical protein